MIPARHRHSGLALAEAPFLANAAQWPSGRRQRPAAMARAVLSALLVAGLLLHGGIMLAEDSETDASEVAATAERPSERQPDPLDGLPIVRIVLVRRDIFDTTDPSTDAWPYRLANALHITSTEAFVRRMLLFTEGDPYRSFAAEESERLLRGTDLVNPVTITARRVEGGVEVTVDTRDRWTLQVGGKLGLFGSRSDYGFSFDESNLLGNGWALGLRYRSNDERSSWTYSVYDPNILGSRWRARLEHEDASDGHGDLVRVDYPFYSLATPRSCGLDWEDGEHRSHLYSEGDSVVEGTVTTEALQLWTGLRLPGERDVTQRLTLGYHRLQRSYADWTWEDGSGAFVPPAPLEVSGIRIGYQRVVDRFTVLQGFRSWVSQEDVALGPNLEAGLTVSLPALGGDTERLLFDASWGRVGRHGSWMVLFEARTSGRVDEGALRDTVIGGQLVAAQIGDRSWLARLMVETSRELDRDRQLALGADLGLRGWDPDYFDGTGRAVANLQWRAKLKDDVLHLFSLGVVAFADAGRTWGARVGPGTDRLHGDVGVGLVADVPQIGLVKLLRLEVALPDDGSGYTLLLTTRSLF